MQRRGAKTRFARCFGESHYEEFTMKLLILAAALAAGGTAMAQDVPAAPPGQIMPPPQTPPDPMPTPPVDAPEAPPAPEGPPSPGGPPPAPPVQTTAGPPPPPAAAPMPSDPASYPPCSRTVTDHCRQRGGI